MQIDPSDFSPASIAALAPACGEGCAPGSVSLVSGAAVWPHRPDLAGKWLWRCACGARCGCHPNLKPVGAPGGLETRKARKEAHAAFDPLWHKRRALSGIKASIARGRGYKWLADQLGIDRKACHIGDMNAAMCRRVVEVCKSATKAKG